MKAIPLNELKNVAEQLAASQARWHFHVVTAACNILPDRNNLVFILEDSGAGTVYAADATEADLDVGAHLLELLHPGITETPDTRTATSVEHDELVAKALEYFEKGIPWHHHVLFPDCEFNPSQGKWTLMLEGDDEIMQESFADEPKAQLREIEPLFYKQSSIG